MNDKTTKINNLIWRLDNKEDLSYSLLEIIAKTIRNHKDFNIQHETIPNIIEWLISDDVVFLHYDENFSLNDYLENISTGYDDETGTEWFEIEKVVLLTYNTYPDPGDLTLSEYEKYNQRMVLATKLGKHYTMLKNKKDKYMI